MFKELLCQTSQMLGCRLLGFFFFFFFSFIVSRTANCFKLKKYDKIIYKTYPVLFMSPYLFSLVFPVSMTNTTSGIVTPVSAILVDKTI